MPGLIAWNRANADFKESGVARELERQGYVWSLADIGSSGRYRASIFPFQVKGSIDLEVLQEKTDIKLELVNV